MAPTPTTSPSDSLSSSSVAASASTSTSILCDAAAQMKQIVERVASHVATEAESTSSAVDGGVTTKVELLLDSCSDVDSLQGRCGRLRRENKMLRIQLDILQLQRTLDEERTSRTLHQLREEAADAAKTELSRGIVEALQGELACSICNEVRSNVN
jgi:glutamine synthetase adenylyltransferase